MGRLTELALKNTTVVMALIIMGIVAGALSFTTHPSREDPKIGVRTAVIFAQFPGMSPERIENLITIKLEESARQVPEIQHIRSTSRTGAATVFVDVYERFSDLEPIWQDLRNKMADIGDLPKGTIGPFVNDDYGNVAMATIAITAEGFSRAEMRQNARFLRDRLYSVPGTRKIDLYGVEEERIFIEVSNARLSHYGLTADQVVGAISNRNIVSPGGAVQADVTSFVVEPTGNFEDLEDIGESIIPVAGDDGGVLYFRDLAKIVRAYSDPPENPAFFNGEPAIVLSVAMMDKYDASKYAVDLRAKIVELENQLPLGYQLSYITFQPDDIALAISNVMTNLYQTVAVVLAIVMIFLGWRTGLIVGATVPLTMVLSVLVMRWIEIDLERMSLATLIIALGLLVDNGTVIAEEIQRRITLGQDRVKAAIDTGKELAMPLLSSSLTTIVAFMPLLLAESAAGEYTRSISQVIAIALLGSWFIALTVTPVMCVWFVKPGKQVDEKSVHDTKFYNSYKKLLTGVLSYRLLFMGAVIGTLGLALWGMQFVPKVFFPASERPQLQVLIDYEAGSNTYATTEGVLQIGRWLKNEETNPEVLNTIGYVADGGPRFYLSLDPVDPDPHRAFMLVNLKSADDLEKVAERIRIYALDSVPDARVQVKPMALGPGEAGLVNYRIYHDDPITLTKAAERVQIAMQQIPFSINVENDWENLTIKYGIEVDQTRAARVGLTSEDISQALNDSLSGRTVSDFREDDTLIPIVVRSQGNERTSLDHLRTLNIFSTSEGTAIPLLQVADFDGIPEYPLLQRRNMERVLTVSGKNVIKTAAQYSADLAPTIEQVISDLGVRVEIGGEIEDSADSQASLSVNMPLALAVIILILVTQFNSIAKPAIILSVIPLTLIGVTLALLIAPGANLGFMGILGLLSLAGIIINNAIVLIDRINIELANGEDQWNAIINASVMRLRPILVTTVTTVCGFLPIILSKDVLFYDLGIVVVGGLSIGTLLTLAVVPVLYAIFYRVKKPELSET